VREHGERVHGENIIIKNKKAYFKILKSTKITNVLLLYLGGLSDLCGKIYELIGLIEPFVSPFLKIEGEREDDLRYLSAQFLFT